MDPRTLREAIYEDINRWNLQKAESFNKIRNVLVQFQEKREWLYYLSQLLDIFEISDTNDRIVICQLMEKCDEKYGINAKYKDLLLEDQELVLKYI